MRLTNERDQEILRAGISDAAASLLEFMPTMGAGEAVTFGEGVALPTRMIFDLLPQGSLPKSTTASFTQNWNKESADGKYLHEIVSRWRQQTYNPLAEPPAQETAEEAPAMQAQGTGFNPQADPRLRAAEVRASIRSNFNRRSTDSGYAGPEGGWPQEANQAWGRLQPSSAKTSPGPEKNEPAARPALSSLLKQYRP
jgi:hypothetical protein